MLLIQREAKHLLKAQIYEQTGPWAQKFVFGLCLSSSSSPEHRTFISIGGKASEGLIHALCIRIANMASLLLQQLPLHGSFSPNTPTRWVKGSSTPKMSTKGHWLSDQVHETRCSASGTWQKPEAVGNMDGEPLALSPSQSHIQLCERIVNFWPHWGGISQTATNLLLTQSDRQPKAHDTPRSRVAYTSFELSSASSCRHLTGYKKPVLSRLPQPAA